MGDDGYRLEPYQSLNSTQDYLLELLKANKDIHKLVIRAYEQSKGKGTQGKQFISNKGGSYQSIAFYDANKSLQKPYSTLYFAISLAKELAKKDINVKIKWPNDIYYQNKKLAGILAQYSKKYLIVGIGLNVNNQIPDNASSINLELDEVNDLVITASLQAYKYFQTDFNLIKEFEAYDYLLTKEIEIQSKTSLLRGFVKGLNNDGCLIVENKQDKYYLCSGHISNIF